MVTPAEDAKSVVGVRFQRAGRVYYFDPAGMEIDINDQVVVETARGQSMGRVVIAPRQVVASELNEALKPVLRKASAEDAEQHKVVQQKERQALTRCSELAAKLNLPIKLRGAESNLSGNYITIFFSAEGRVDFRQLVRELAANLRVRVELHQVGPRDETKLIGGVGRCGYQLCCASFLTDFKPLSIRMAKEQSLSLEPTKISGICGRLLCCLGYEAEFYRSMKERLPPVGARVKTPMGEGTVSGANVLKEAVIVQFESQVPVEFPLAEVTRLDSGEVPKKKGGRPRN
ncbi:MAG: stage 0 sporulation family protein [Chloroflexi bacterium]|nr:stage 0 sporulation family protein [Chloroflexota bacterium]